MQNEAYQIRYEFYFILHVFVLQWLHGKQHTTSRTMFVGQGCIGYNHRALDSPHRPSTGDPATASGGQASRTYHGEKEINIKALIAVRHLWHCLFVVYRTRSEERRLCDKNIGRIKSI